MFNKLWKEKHEYLGRCTYALALLGASVKVCLKVNAKRTKYMLLLHHQNAGQNLNTRIANRSFENVAQFKYLGTRATNQNLILEEIKRMNEFR
jgi:hypothetical protein